MGSWLLSFSPPGISIDLLEEVWHLREVNTGIRTPRGFSGEVLSCALVLVGANIEHIQSLEMVGMSGALQ